MIRVRVGERAISLVSFSLLARLLYPDDYGLFALALALIATLEAVGSRDFDATLFRSATGVVPGAIAYGFALLMAWILAGRPAGAERQVLDLLVTVRKRMSTWQQRVTGDAS